MDPAVEETICQLRGAHPRWGARRIQAELARRGIEPAAVSSIHQALRRNHLVAPQPPRRPKALKRFEREVSNDLWQIDATCVRLASRKKAWVLDTIDDHSRYLLAILAAEAPTGEAAWDCFEEAASRYGLPRQVLSDNGMCFTGRLQGVEVEFERQLADLGVELITAGPYHPQTLGKLERFHKTLKAWLSEEGPPYDLPHLQELLDAFRHHYNRERPHQGIGNLTPAQRYRYAPPVAEAAASEGVDERGEPVYPPHSIVRKVSACGQLGYRSKQITVGRRWAGARVRIIPVNGLIHILYGEELVRALAIDPDSYNQRLERGMPKVESVR
jgi:transposase InsO family protein